MKDSKYAKFVLLGEIGNQATRKAFTDEVYRYVRGTSDDIVVPTPEFAHAAQFAKLTADNEEALKNVCAVSEQVAVEVVEYILQQLGDLHAVMAPLNEARGSELLFMKEVEGYKADSILNPEIWNPVKSHVSKNYSPEVNVEFYEKELAEEIEKRKKLHEIRKIENPDSPLKIKGKMDFTTGKITSIEEIIAEQIKPYMDDFDKSNIRVEALKDNFVKDWKEAFLLIQTKKELKAIDEFRKERCEELYKRINEFQRIQELLEPFLGNLGRLWDLSKGAWHTTGFNVLKMYAELLKKDKNLRELAEVLGRYRMAEREYEEEIYQDVLFTYDVKFDYSQRSELVGIRESDDLNNMLPSETALLSFPDTEHVFMKKYAEKKLQTYEFRAKYFSAKEEKVEKTRTKSKESDKGPFILCVDTSGSMHGTPEHVAKVLAFAIIKMAINDNRKCYLISFSNAIQTLDMSDLGANLEKLISFLGMSFHGGTDANPALQEALKKLKTDDYKKADVLVISDFIMQKFCPSMISDINTAKNDGTRFFSLTIADSGNTDVTNEFDENWIYDPDHPDTMIELVKKLKRWQNCAGERRA